MAFTLKLEAIAGFLSRMNLYILTSSLWLLCGEFNIEEHRLKQIVQLGDYSNKQHKRCEVAALGGGRGGGGRNGQILGTSSM